MKIIVKNGVAIAQSKTAVVVQNGIQLDNMILGVPCSSPSQFLEELPEIISVDDVPLDFAPHKYLYTTNGGFKRNATYNEPFGNAQERILVIEDTLAELIMGGAM